MREFYETNKDFKEYVDKYAKKTHITPDEALTHASVREAYEYYKNKAKEDAFKIDDK